MRWPRAQLRQRRRRRVRGGARRGRGRGAGAEGGRRAGLHADAGLLHHLAGGHDLAGGRGAAARGQGRAAGADAGQPRRLLPALGQDLGVPGAAQGPPGRGRPRAGPGLRRRDGADGVGRQRSATTSWSTCSRCAAGSSRRCRPPTATASSSSGPAACGTWSSRSSCCSWCTAAPTRRCAAPTPSRRSSRCRPTATSGATTPPSWTAPTGSCARSSTGCSCTGCGAPTSCPRTPTSCAGSARSLGLRTDPVAALDREWRQHAREVRRLHEKLFYRPLLSSVARLASDEARLTPEAARSRLEALGYEDPAGALRHLEALTAGVSRRAAIQRTLLPVLLGWFADAPDPDGGLLAFRQLSDALGTTPGTCGCCATRAPSPTGWRCCWRAAGTRSTCSAGRRRPCGCSPTTPSWCRAGARSWPPRSLPRVGRHDDPASAVAVARGVRRRELFRVAAADLLGPGDRRAGRGGPDRRRRRHRAGRAGRRAPRRWSRPAADRCRPGSRSSRWAGSAAASWATPATPTCCSCTTRSRAPTSATPRRPRTRSCGELRRLLAVPSPDPPLVVDADLRPEGRQGPLVRTPGVLRRLLRAVVAGLGEPGAAAGRAGGRRRGARPRAVRRWSTRCATATAARRTADVREIRRIKARVEAERLPRGADPHRHTKLGPGGLADVEWTVQLLQLRHARGACPGCGRPGPWRRSTRPRPPGCSTPGAGPGAATRLADREPGPQRDPAGARAPRGHAAHRSARADRCGAGARLPSGRGGVLVDDYRRASRRARTVVEQVFYR